VVTVGRQRGGKGHDAGDARSEPGEPPPRQRRNEHRGEPTCADGAHDTDGFAHATTTAAFAACPFANT